MPESSDFAVVYARYLPPIQAKCRRLLGRAPAAEDVAQETFLRLWKSGLARDGRDEVRTIMAWLYRTCTRLAIDVLRERRWTSPDEVNPDASPCSVDAVGGLEARRAIVALAKSVPEEELSVAVLCRVDGLPQPEAAAILGISERTVRRMLDRFDERVRPLREELSA